MPAIYFLLSFLGLSSDFVSWLVVCVASLLGLSHAFVSARRVPSLLGSCFRCFLLVPSFSAWADDHLIEWGVSIGP